MKTITFSITPIGKPRMVRSDAWSKRSVVLEYWAFKDQLNLQANSKKYVLGDTLDILFILPMSESWSKKKKKVLVGTAHQQKPDIDNLVKAFMDALREDDAAVYDIHAQKIWGLGGQINVFKK